MNIKERIKCGSYNRIINYRDYEEDVLYDPETDEYFSDIDEMEWYYEYNELEMPRYAYGCEFEPVQADVDWILDYITDDHADGVRDSIVGIDKLEEAINEFNRANKEAMVGSYYEDLGLIIELF